MKHALFWPLFALIACHCLAFVQAASPQLEMRKVHRGTLGNACRPKHRCNSGLICYANKCYGKTGRPLLAPCKIDTACSTGYCGKAGRCSKQREIGKPCWRSTQCLSGSCDAGTAKCATKSAADVASSANAALASAASVSDSKPFFDSSLSRPLLQVTGGQIKTVGSVKIVSTAAGPAVEMAADGQHPAAIVHQLGQALSRRDVATTTGTLSFNYLVNAFTSTSGGQCNLVPYVNGVPLTPFIAIKATQPSAKASYPYSGAAISSYAVGVVCDAGTRGVVDFDTVSLTVTKATSNNAAAPPAGSAATTTTTAPTTTSTPGSTVNAGSSPLPTGACIGLPDCDLEAGGKSLQLGTAGSSKWCALDTPTYDSTNYGLGGYRSGQGAAQCDIYTASDVAYLQSTPNLRSYTPGSPYVWSFWVRGYSSKADFGALSCTIWEKAGTGAVVYNGTCPLTTAAAASKGFRQVAIPFTATDAEMDFMININGFTQDNSAWSFDDFSMLDGQYAIAYDSASQPPSVGSAAAAPAACTGPLQNCGFESGYANGWNRLQYGSPCSVTADANNVHDGNRAYMCNVVANTFTYRDGSDVGAGVSQTVPLSSLTAGSHYSLSFWAKSLSNSNIAARISTSATAYFDAVVTPTQQVDANGFTKYIANFKIDAAETQDITFAVSARQPDVYYFDGFALASLAITDPGTTLPARCSGLQNCNFEDVYTGSSTVYPVTFQTSSTSSGGGDPQCAIANGDGPFARSGNNALSCSIGSANQYVYLQGGKDHTYTARAPMTLTFWARTTGGATPNSLKCSIWTGNGNDQVIYDDKCPFTTAAAVNGYKQVAIPFTVPDVTSVSFLISTSDQGVYAFDDFSMLDGNSYDVSYASPLPSSTTTTVGATCGNNAFQNCGWESGYMNGLQVQQQNKAYCSVIDSANNAGFVHGGHKALKCILPTSSDYIYVNAVDVPDAMLANDVSYKFTFWAKGISPSNLPRVSAQKGFSSSFTPDSNNVQAIGAADGNGFQQYSMTFKVSRGTGNGQVSVGLSPSGTYYLDDFALTAVSSA